MRPGVFLAAVTGGTAAIALSGCGGGAPQHVTLPAKATASATSQPSPAPTPSAEAAVAVAYTTFWSLDGPAERSALAKAEQVLAPYVAQPYLGHLLAQMRPYRQRHEAARGYVTPHITQITVTGDHAVVRDCQDQSHAALASTQTGRVIPRTTGARRTSYVASLEQGSDGRWRLTALEQLAQPCKPGSASS